MPQAGSRQKPLGFPLKTTTSKKPKTSKTSTTSKSLPSQFFRREAFFHNFTASQFTISKILKISKSTISKISKSHNPAAYIQLFFVIIKKISGKRIVPGIFVLAVFGLAGFSSTGGILLHCDIAGSVDQIELIKTKLPGGRSSAAGITADTADDITAAFIAAMP